jgi:hypothetical protein
MTDSESTAERIALEWLALANRGDGPEFALLGTVIRGPFTSKRAPAT